jgi:hypothetical protein
MIVAGTGAGSETDTWPIVLNEVIGPLGAPPRATFRSVCAREITAIQHFRPS